MDPMGSIFFLPLYVRPQKKHRPLPFTIQQPGGETEHRSLVTTFSKPWGMDARRGRGPREGFAERVGPTLSFQGPRVDLGKGLTLGLVWVNIGGWHGWHPSYVGIISFINHGNHKDPYWKNRISFKVRPFFFFVAHLGFQIQVLL